MPAGIKVVEALELTFNIYKLKGGISGVKAYRDSAGFFDAGNQFATDELIALPMYQWYVNVLLAVSAEAHIAFDSFRGLDGEQIAFATGAAWAIPADTDSEAAACRFMKLMTETDAWMAAAVTMVPTFLIWNSLGQVGTLTPLWAQNLFGSAFYIFLLRQFFLSLPRDTFEAARIDGANNWTIFWRMALPLTKPAIVVTLLFNFKPHGLTSCAP